MIYEMKKLLHRKEVWLVLGLSLIAIFLLNCRDQWVSPRRMQITQQKMSAYSDMPLADVQPLIEREWKQLGGYSSPALGSAKYDDWKVLDDLRDCVIAYLKHEENMQMLVAKMYNDLTHSATDFERRDITQAIRLYNRKTQYQVCPYNELLFTMQSVEHDDPIHDLYLLILCTLLSPLFAVESETGMYQVLFASKKGKTGLYRKKIAGGMLCAALFALLYTAVTFAILWLKHGLSIRLLLAPIQCADLYQNCPYSFSILTFAALTATMRALVGAFIVALTALMSCCFRKTLAVFGSTAAFTAILVFLSYLFKNIPIGQMVMKHIGLMRLPHLGDYLTQYDTVNVFGFPVMQFWLSILCTCGVILCILAVAYALYTKRHSRK